MVKAAVLYEINSELEIVDLSISDPKDKEVLISMDSADKLITFGRQNHNSGILVILKTFK